jgi:hypothetical protein
MNSTKRKTVDRDRIDKLSQSKKIELKNELDSECTFQPKIKVKKGSEGGGENGADYVQRMEAKEENRRKSKEKERGRLDYDAKIDKLSCPKCGTIQTYDEVISKKKYCQNPHCNMQPYTKGKTWADCERSFVERLQEQEKKKAERLAKVKEEEERKYVPKPRLAFDRDTGRMKEVKPTKIPWDEVQKGFFERTESKMAEKDEKKKELEMKYKEDKQFDFKPKLNSNPRVRNATPTITATRWIYILIPSMPLYHLPGMYYFSYLYFDIQLV